MSFNPEKMINKTVSSMPPSGIRRFFRRCGRDGGLHIFRSWRA